MGVQDYDRVDGEAVQHMGTSRRPGRRDHGSR